MSQNKITISVQRLKKSYKNTPVLTGVDFQRFFRGSPLCQTIPGLINRCWASACKTSARCWD